MSNYAKPLAHDTGGTGMVNSPPPYPAQARRIVDNAVASSVMNISPTTTIIEVGAHGGTGAVIRWVPLTETAAAAGAKASVVSSGLGANFDHYIPNQAVRTFIVPRETQGTAAGQVGSVNGLYQRVAIINAGSASSIITAEY